MTDKQVTHADRECADDIFRLIKACILDPAGKREISVSVFERKVFERLVSHRIASTAKLEAERDELLREIYEECYSLAIAESNHGHVEGNRRAFKIAHEIQRRKKSRIDQHLQENTHPSDIAAAYEKAAQVAEEIARDCTTGTIEHSTAWEIVRIIRKHAEGEAP